MKLPVILLSVLISGLSFTITAQNYAVSGMILDFDEKTPLTGATLVITNPDDSDVIKYSIADLNGNFVFHSLKNQKYRLKSSFIGYENIDKIIDVKKETENLGILYMKQKQEKIKEVIISGQAPAAVQKTDTTEMFASAYKTNKDANAEDLVKKMPTVTIENNTVTAQGENVKQVLVDGKPFFGDDPTVALRSLPAEVIDKIQLFNKLSDQAELTGFDDGQTTKTMNIVTKKNSRNGTFGKLYAGHDYFDKFQSGGNLNLFNGERRITIIGMSNNINQQNFSAQDLIGISGNAGGNRFSGGGGGGPMGARRGNSGGGFNSFGGNNATNFLVGQQNGISATNSIGLNYSDVWGPKIKISGSYFFNNSNNDLEQSTYRKFADNSAPLSDNELSTSQNYNNRLNLRIEYSIDSMNTAIFTPKLNFQNNHSHTGDKESNLLNSGNLIDLFSVKNNLNTSAYNLSGELTYRHKFAKKGRTLSIRLDASDNSKNPVTILQSGNINYATSDSSNDSVSQQSDATTKNKSISENLMYTEPLGKNGLLQFNYSNSFSNNTTHKLTYDMLNYTSADILPIDTSLSNIYNNNYLTNSAGIGYRIKGEKFNASVNLNYQRADLTGNRTFPISDSSINRTFDNFVPGAMFRYNFSNKNNLMIFYRASTNPPSISQLQNVIDNSNPKMLSTGNPELKQEYSHTLVSRFAFANPEKSRNLFGFLSVTYTLNSISNFTDTARRDIELYKGIIYSPGTQLTQPINLDNSWAIRSLLTYGFPLKFIECNMNLNSSFNFSRIPGKINDLINISNSYTFAQGIVLSSNISEDVDFTLSYTGNYNIIKNSIQPQLNNNYFMHSANFRFNWIFWKGIVVQNDITNQLYKGLSSNTYNQNYLLWNIALGKKLFKKQQGEIRLSVFDLLNQNNAISITNIGNYTDYSQVNALKRYYMLTFTYNFKIFKNGQTDKSN